MKKASQQGDALKRFELENQVKIDESIYQFVEAEQDKILEARPWNADPYYFKHVKISAIAMIKMLNHAKRGDPIEVMGLMTGKIAKGMFYVLDAYALPVEGTETRVNAGADAAEYMVNFREMSETIGKPENIVGWYHSHPGYGCWLSKIDIDTERLQQQVQDPYFAIVVDPQQSMSAGKVEIGCFRTFPPDSQAIKQKKKEDKGASVPLQKLQQYGLHANEYYQIEHSFFKSTLDSDLLDVMWREYWIQTLAYSPFSSNKTYFSKSIKDLGKKIERQRSKQSSQIEDACCKLTGQLQQAYLTELVKMTLLKK